MDTTRSAAALRSPSVVVMLLPEPQAAALIRGALQSAFPSARVEQAMDGVQLKSLMGSLLPDLVVLDLNLLDDLRLAFEVEPSRRHARAELIVVAGHAQDDRVLPALRFGAIGTLFKHDLAGQAVAHLHDIYTGLPPLNGPVAGQILRELDWNGLSSSLSNEEVELLTWIYAGDSVKEAGARIGIAKESVMEMIVAIWQKAVVRAGITGLAAT